MLLRVACIAAQTQRYRSSGIHFAVSAYACHISDRESNQALPHSDGERLAASITHAHVRYDDNAEVFGWACAVGVRQVYAVNGEAVFTCAEPM